LRLNPERFVVAYAMDFDIQLDERGRLKLPASLRDALTASPEMCLHVTMMGDTIVLRRSPKPPPAPGDRTTPTRVRKARKAPPAKPQ
jgi:bifunctional DNA-binding transcriptional regulator/antitoxin component of YhaV-PrlF toxin-antitoxin module